MKRTYYESINDIKIGDVVGYKFGTYTSKGTAKISSEVFRHGDQNRVRIEFLNGKTLPINVKYVWKVEV